MKSVKRMDALERFESATLPHTSDLFRSAMCLLGNASEAEMAVEECLLNAWRSVGEFGSSINHRTRLHKILLQIVSRRRYELSNRFPPAAQPQTAEDPIAALRASPEQFAQVVLLADVHEFTYEEIQETLGISAVTLASRLSRGRDEFACALSGAPKSSMLQLPWRDGLEESRGLQAAQ